VLADNSLGIELGPLVPLRMDELAPGALGWRREARAPGDADSGGSLGSVGLVVAPAGAAAGEPAESFVRSGSGERPELRALSDGPPRVFLWVRSERPTGKETLERLADRIGEEFRSEPQED
jgi:hypothetical protein